MAGMFTQRSSESSVLEKSSSSHTDSVNSTNTNDQQSFSSFDATSGNDHASLSERSSTPSYYASLNYASESNPPDIGHLSIPLYSTSDGGAEANLLSTDLARSHNILGSNFSILPGGTEHGQSGSSQWLPRFPFTNLREITERLSLNTSDLHHDSTSRALSDVERPEHNKSDSVEQCQANPEQSHEQNTSAAPSLSYQDSTSQNISDFELPEHEPVEQYQASLEQTHERNNDIVMSESVKLKQSEQRSNSEVKLTSSSHQRYFEDTDSESGQDHSFNLNFERRPHSNEESSRSQVENQSSLMWRLVSGATSLISSLVSRYWQETPLEPGRVRIENGHMHHTVPDHETIHKHKTSESQLDPMQNLERPDCKNTNGSVSVTATTPTQIISTCNSESEVHVQSDFWEPSNTKHDTPTTAEVQPSYWEPSSPTYDIPMEVSSSPKQDTLTTVQYSTPSGPVSSACLSEPEMNVADSYEYQKSSNRNLEEAKTLREVKKAVELEAHSIVLKLSIKYGVSSEGVRMTDIIKKQLICSAENLLIEFAAIYIESESAPQVLQNLNSAIKYCREGLRSALPEHLKEFADLINVSNTLSVLKITLEMLTGYLGIAMACSEILKIIGLHVCEMAVKFGSGSGSGPGSGDGNGNDDKHTKTAAKMLLELIELLIKYLRTLIHTS